MKVLIAGACAIGRPLLSYLDDVGHELFAVIRSRKAAGTREPRRARQVVADARDAASVLDEVQHVNPDVIINELTSLRKHYTLEEGGRRAAQGRASEGQFKPAGGRVRHELSLLLSAG